MTPRERAEALDAALDEARIRAREEQRGSGYDSIEMIEAAITESEIAAYARCKKIADDAAELMSGWDLKYGSISGVASDLARDISDAIAVLATNRRRP